MQGRHARLNPHRLRLAAGEKEPPGSDVSATWNSLRDFILVASLSQQDYRFGANEGPT